MRLADDYIADDYDDIDRNYVAITLLGLIGLVISCFMLGYLFGYKSIESQVKEPRGLTCMTARIGL